jgi:hypothetical protein
MRHQIPTQKICFTFAQCYHQKKVGEIVGQHELRSATSLQKIDGRKRWEIGRHELLSATSLQEIDSWGRFLVYRELSPILDAQLLDAKSLNSFFKTFEPKFL